MVTLVIDTGSGSELNYEFTKNSISIGASSTNDVVLRAPGVAPHHLTLTRKGESLTFVVQQRQVVLLNGDRRARGLLEIGDKIRIGTAALTVRKQEPNGVAQAGITAGQKDIEEVVAAHPHRSETTKTRPEVVVYNEPERLALARRLLLEIFQSGANADVASSLEGFFATVFPGRNALLAWLDQKGQLQPISANWNSASMAHSMP